MGSNMQLTERSYGGKLFRPRPEVLIADDKSFMVIATPWGPRRMAQMFIEKIATEMQNTVADPDLTMVAASVDYMNDKENSLRMALLKIHEDLREEFNAESLTSGLEIFCLLRNQKKVSWYQLGSPFVAILRDSVLTPLHNPLDLSFDYSDKKTLAPLPRQLFGISQQIHLEQGSFLQKDNDRLLLIARSSVPSEVVSLAPQEVSLETVTQLLAKNNAEQPFWLALLNL
jgi:hypothetical protein